MQVMIVLEHFPKEDLRKFLVQMGRRYIILQSFEYGKC